MNKTDRLLAIVLELQRKKRTRAEDLAAIFETSVRTIYRDIQALCEAGVPVIGAPGQGYSLAEGYFLPPISFTVDEAVALLIGTDFVDQRFGTEYGAKARVAKRKIEAILPERIRSEASRERATIKLLAPGERDMQGREAASFEALRPAILEERKVRFSYTKRISETDDNATSIRTVAPYGLVLVNGSWTLIAFCELRQGIRHFRLSRMRELAVLEDRFRLPSDFNLQDYEPPNDRHLLVRVLVHARIADRVKELGNFYMIATESHPEGHLVTFRVRQPEELVEWVLGWGADVVVLEPESLRVLIRGEAGKMRKRY